MTVYRRGKSWYINITMNGVRINRKAGTTRKEAIEVQDEIRTSVRKRKLKIEEIRQTTTEYAFSELATEYFSHCKSIKAKRTYEMEKSYYDVHIAPHVADKLMSAIDNELLLTLQGILKQRLANRSVNICIGIVRKIVNHAVVKKYFDDPGLKYPHLKESKKLHAFLTFEEYERLIAIQDAEFIINRIIVGRNTGMRPAELAFLAWDDVNFDTKDIKIQGKKGIWQPKTSEERVIPMNNQVVAILSRMKLSGNGRWVFGKNGKPIIDIGKSLATAAEKAGITRKVTPNMLRHTFATHALMKGADLKSVQMLMGHTEIETTVKSPCK